MWSWVALLVALSTAAAYSQDRSEPKCLPPIAESSAPDCPNSRGLRESRSALAVSSNEKITAYIAGSARRANDYSCRQDAALVIKDSDKRQQIKLQGVTRSKTELERNDLEAPYPTRSYSVIDFSSDGRFVLLDQIGTDSWRNDTFRDVEIAVLDVSARGQPKWINIWDLMHWADCNATVEPQGFDKAGVPVVRVRPSVWHQKAKRDCVTKPELWAVDLDRTTATRLPDDTLLSRNGVSTGVDWITCKNDPDIVAACFSVHGRLSIWNGTPSLRMSRIGTNRILGVRTETAPANVSKLWGTDPFRTEIYGDFEVCPFTKSKPGEMQMVCVESASHLLAKPR